MHNLASRLLHDEDSARDIVHDVFATILATGQTAPTSLYLLKAVRNRCLNFIRKLSNGEKVKGLYSDNLSEIEDEEWPDDDTIKQINDSINSLLSEQCQKVVRMRFTEDMRYREISEALGISEVAVYKHLRHAIDVLRQKLNENG